MRMHPARPWTNVMSAVVLTMAVSGIGACSSSAPATTSTLRVTGAHLSASDFSTAMKAPGTIVLDVRTPAEFATGHLPGAKNMDVEGADFAARIGALDKTATYAVYCHSGNRSATAMEQMVAVSFAHLYDLAGGLGAWQTMGGPMSMDGS